MPVCWLCEMGYLKSILGSFPSPFDWSSTRRIGRNTMQEYQAHETHFSSYFPS